MKKINDSIKEQIIEALEFIPACNLSYREWCNIGIACYSSGLDFSYWDSWSSKNDNRYNPGICASAWKSFSNHKYTRVTYKTIFWHAIKYGYKPPKEIDYKEWKEEFNSYLEKQYGKGSHLVNEYRYTDECGAYKYSKIRIEGGKLKSKLFLFFAIDEENGTFNKLEQPQRFLYHLPKLLNGIKKGFPVVIVEGEKDCITIENLDGFACAVTTAGSATSWKQEFAKVFIGCDVIVLRDNDEDGERLAKQIRHDLKPYAHTLKILNLSRLEKGDVTDYLTKECGTAESLKSAIENTTSEFAPWISFDSKKLRIVPGMLAKNIEANMNYFIVRLPEDDKDSVFLYRSGVYVRSNKNSVKAMISEFIPDHLISDALLNNVYSLLMASEEKVKPYEFLYSEYRYINFRNGLLDVATDEFIQHTPKIVTTYQYDFDYDSENLIAPNFTTYLCDFCKDVDGNIDSKKMRILQEVGGLILSSDRVSKTKKIPVLYSAEGNSGKSVFISILENFLGMERITSANLRDLTPENRFVFGKLQSTRLITCGDESNTTINDSSILKRLLGGDSIKIEAKGRQGYSSKYNGGIIIACNGLPIFADDKGNQMFERLLIIPCEHHIEVENRDANILERILREKSAIFNFFYQGYKRLVSNEYIYTEADCIDNVLEEYRMNSDSLYRFIIEKCERTQDSMDRISRAEFDKAFIDWALMEGVEMIPKNLIKIRMESIGIRLNRLKCEGITQNVYCGIKWK